MLYCGLVLFLRIFFFFVADGAKSVSLRLQTSGFTPKLKKQEGAPFIFFFLRPCELKGRLGPDKAPADDDASVGPEPRAGFSLLHACGVDNSRRGGSVVSLAFTERSGGPPLTFKLCEMRRYEQGERGRGIRTRPTSWRPYML